ncbi:MAG: hypothetical protein Q8R70_03610 [Methanoregula sp.]|nr:hypothetical protein [Methanoregula sp.]
MTATPSERSPLARLVLFMFCIAIAGSLVAGLHYFTIDLPQQQAVTAPENSSCRELCRAIGTDCTAICMTESCRSVCKVAWTSCVNNCHN